MLIAVDETLGNASCSIPIRLMREMTIMPLIRMRSRLPAIAARPPLPDGRMVLEDGMAERRAEAEDDSKDWDTEVVLGRMEGGFNNHRFSGYWNSETDMTHPVILARSGPASLEVFAHLPFGNWNDCPDTPQLMAVARYWFEKSVPVPAVMTHDELDFALPKPIGRELAVQTALEQYAFCPDMDQNHESVGALADTLRQSKIWYFWWD